jgi:hypothetical protein
MQWNFSMRWPENDPAAAQEDVTAARHVVNGTSNVTRLDLSAINAQKPNESAIGIMTSGYGTTRDLR